MCTITNISVGIAGKLSHRFATDANVHATILEILEELDMGKIPEVPNSLEGNNELGSKLFQYCHILKEYYTGNVIDFTLDDSPQSWVDHALNNLRAELLCRRGEYDDALDIILVAFDTDPDPYLQAAYHSNLALIYHDLGDYDTSISSYNLAIEKIQDPDDPLKYKSMIGLADVYIHTGGYQVADDLLQTALENLDRLGSPFFLGYANHIMGIYYYFTAHPDQSMIHLQKALTIYGQLGNDLEAAKVHYSIAELSYSLGDFQLARKHLDMTRPEFEKIGNLRDYSFIFLLQALMLSAENFHNDAINSINQSISLLREVGNRSDLSSGYQVKGEILYRQGKYTAASEYVKKSLQIKRDFGNATLIALSLFFLILINQRSGNNKIAEGYFQELTELNETEDVAYLSNFHLAAKGFLLKAKNRLKHKVRAQEIFNELRNNPELEYDLRIFVMINILELLLLELQLFEKPAVIKEILDILDEIDDLAEHNHHYTLKVEINILHAKFFLIQGEITQSFDMLKDLEQQVEEFNNDFLKERVAEEKEHLEQELDTWNQNLAKGSSLSEMIETSQLQDYLHDISKRFEFDKL